ncbi:N(1)-aminopropylagmatine ureohydrolase [Candidatus Norongarragalina meridionalis]|nr:N(1)-aminopropylagmatine ureohydrolase [Candidatus Norongarragalina meridionalis]
MKLLHSLPPYNFAGQENDFRSAKFVVVPVPYDSTCSFNAGTRDAPHMMIAASRFMEEKKCGGIFTTEELEPCRADAKETMRRITQVVGDVLDAKKVPVVLGGEHTVTYGALKAFHGDDFSILALDAHLDFRDEFEGSPLSHACTLRRASEIAPVTVVGCRSWGAEEAKDAKKKGVRVFGSRFDAKEVAKGLKKNVYVSIDFDALDGFPTGMPEPNGVRYSDAFELLQTVLKTRRLIGLDGTELLPASAGEAYPAAKLVYEILCMVG